MDRTPEQESAVRMLELSKPIAEQCGDTFIDFRDMSPTEQWVRIVSLLAAEGWSLHRLDDPTQADTLAWVRSQWPDAVDVKSRALKLGEEAGEVQGAVVKMSEGRRTLADLETETAQLVICAMALAESAGFDLWAAVTAEYRSKALVPVESGETAVTNRPDGASY